MRIHRQKTDYFQHNCERLAQFLNLVTNKNREKIQSHTESLELSRPKLNLIIKNGGPFNTPFDWVPKDQLQSITVCPPFNNRKVVTGHSEKNINSPHNGQILSF